MLSVLRLDDPSASLGLSKALPVWNSLGLLLSSLEPTEVSRGRVGVVAVGLRGLINMGIDTTESNKERSRVSELLDPRVRGEISSELLRSGKSKDSSTGFRSGTELDSHVDEPRVARWGSGVGGRMCREGGG